MPAFQAGNAGSSPATRTKICYSGASILRLLVFVPGHVCQIHFLSQKLRNTQYLLHSDKFSTKKDWACAGVGEPGQTVNLLAYA